jgi:hypothetical protein
MYYCNLNIIYTIINGIHKSICVLLALPCLYFCVTAIRKQKEHSIQWTVVKVTGPTLLGKDWLALVIPHNSMY